MEIIIAFAMIGSKLEDVRVNVVKQSTPQTHPRRTSKEQGNIKSEKALTEASSLTHEFSMIQYTQQGRVVDRSSMEAVIGGVIQTFCAGEAHLSLLYGIGFPEHK